MSNSLRKQNTDLTRIVGILFLEMIAALVLLNLAAFAQQQRTEADHEPASIAPSTAKPFVLAASPQTGRNSLPKVAVGRYNVDW